MVTLLCCFVALLCEFADVHIKRSINFIGYIFAVLFALFNALGQQIFNLTVDRAEVVLRPCGDIVIQLFR